MQCYIVEALLKHCLYSCLLQLFSDPLVVKGHEASVATSGARPLVHIDVSVHRSLTPSSVGYPIPRTRRVPFSAGVLSTLTRAHGNRAREKERTADRGRKRTKANDERERERHREKETILGKGKEEAGRERSCRSRQNVPCQVAKLMFKIIPTDVIKTRLPACSQPVGQFCNLSQIISIKHAKLVLSLPLSQYGEMMECFYAATRVRFTFDLVDREVRVKPHCTATDSSVLSPVYCHRQAYDCTRMERGNGRRTR